VIDRCPHCDAAIGRAAWSPSATYEYGGPWKTQYTITCGPCFNCGRHVVSVDRPNRPSVGWANQFVTPREGVDYDLLSRRRRRAAQDGGGGGVALWPWSPLWDDPDYRTRSMQMHPLDVRTLLILPPGTTGDFDRFDEVWRLRPHLMSDASGPYPSVRAEIAITDLTKHANVHLRHVWPAVTLDPWHYKNTDGPKALARAWAGFNRGQITITSGSESKHVASGSKV
jgi:hypothetical protein